MAPGHNWNISMEALVHKIDKQNYHHKLNFIVIQPQERYIEFILTSLFFLFFSFRFILILIFFVYREHQFYKEFQMIAIMNSSGRRI